MGIERPICHLESRAITPFFDLSKLFIFRNARLLVCNLSLVKLLKALILAGGFGTRLRPLSCTRPKTLFPIVNKPLLQWVFERLVKSNFEEAILAVNQQTEFYIRQNRVPRYGLEVRYSRDPPRKPLGTAGPIKKAEKLIGLDKPFLVLNGDIFADFSYGEMMKNHREGKAVATIALYEVEDPSRYGVVDLSEDCHIRKFIEKPTKGNAPTNLINAGIYVLSPSIFEYIPKGKTVSMEREVFPKLAEEGVLFGYVVQGFWKDIGNPEEYLQTNRLILDDLAQGETRPNVTEFETKYPVAFDRGVSIGKNSIIGPYAIIGKNVTIGKNVKITDTVIFPNAIVGDFSSIEGAIIGEGATIGKKVQVQRGCIVGDQARLRDGVSVANKSFICPGKEVAESILKTTMIC